MAEAVPVFIYDLSLRIWHWVVAAAVTVQLITGVLLGHSTWLGAQSGALPALLEVHVLTGQVLGLCLLARGWWLFSGATHLKRLYTVPLTDPRLLRDLLWQVKLYLGLTKEPRALGGQNPWSRLVMLALFLCTGLFLASTGAWLAGLFPGDGPVHASLAWLAAHLSSVSAAHQGAMWVMAAFVAAHLNAVFRAERRGQETVISTMLSGWRFPRGAPR